MAGHGRPRIFNSKPKSTTFYLEADLLRKTKVTAAIMGISKSEFVRLAIKEAIEKYLKVS